jgi:Fe-S cluster biogenesis protein NfuA
MQTGQAVLNTVQKIEEFLNVQVRPFLKTHNGDIIIHSFEDGVLKVRMLGGCANCPSAVSEIEQMVAESIIGSASGVRSVIVVTGVSNALLEEARALLRRN